MVCVIQVRLDLMLSSGLKLYSALDMKVRQVHEKRTSLNAMKLLVG